ncbi:hypothetical protein [Streptomyces hundungensis]|uniref:hypothetical protein n=1 Tax=Streptomyces hundungensis TaxID=1077946 RepID=UPI0033799776
MAVQADGDRMTLIHQTGRHILPGGGVVLTALDEQDLFVVATKVRTREDSVHDGDLDLRSAHYRTLTARSRQAQLRFGRRWVVDFFMPPSADNAAPEVEVPR